MRQSTRLLAGGVAALACFCALMLRQRPLHDQHLPPPRSTHYLVDLNTASASELALLPGVGPQLAQRIVEYRQRFGPFDSPQQIRRVHGIGPTTAQRISPWVRCGR